MAEHFKACSIDGCNGNAHHTANGKRGWCNRHYKRFYRYGDPLVIKRTPDGEALAWLVANAGHVGAACLPWPFAKAGTGYGVVRDTITETDRPVRGQPAHRVMCILAHGQPPTPSHEAAHSCGLGHTGCVNPGHLRRATKSENAQEAVEHGAAAIGERHGNAVLTDAGVRFIRANRNTMSSFKIAKLLGVSRSAVAHVIQGRSWRHVI